MQIKIPNFISTEEGLHDRMNELPPGSNVEPRVTESRQTERPPDDRPARNFETPASVVQVAILPANYPQELLSKEQQTTLESLLIVGILKCPEDMIGLLTFKGIKFRNGIVTINCGNDDVAAWVRGLVPRLEHWEGPALATATGDDIPTGNTVKIFFPRSVGFDSQLILDLVRRQNQGIDTRLWRVYKVKNCRNTDGTLMILGIDELSAELIRRRDHTVNFRFGDIPVRGLRRPEEEMTVAF